MSKGTKQVWYERHTKLKHNVQNQVVFDESKKSKILYTHAPFSAVKPTNNSVRFSAPLPKFEQSTLSNCQPKLVDLTDLNHFPKIQHQAPHPHTF